MSKEQLAYILTKSDENPPPDNLTPQTLRAWFEEINAHTPIVEGCSFERVRCTRLGGDLTSLPDIDQSKLIIYYHGGGFMIGSSRSHRVITTNLARLSGCAVLSVDYRLLPEHPRPAAYGDALAAYRWALERGCPASRIALAGDSAGAHLALATALRAKSAGLPMPGALVLFSGAFDFAGDGASHTELADAPLLNRELMQLFSNTYVGSDDPRSPEVTPLYADFSGLPATLVHVGSWELLRDDSLDVTRRLQEVGVAAELKVWEGMCHDWQLFAPFLDEAMESLAQAGEFMRQHLV